MVLEYKITCKLRLNIGGTLVSNRFILAFFLLVMPVYVIHALNDMPLLAQLQGEHNMSSFGFMIKSLDFNHDGFDDLVVYSASYGYQYQQSPSRGKVYIYYGGPGLAPNQNPTLAWRVITPKVSKEELVQSEIPVM